LSSGAYFFTTLFGMPQIPASIVERVEKQLYCKVTGYRTASGGCINHGGELVTSKGSKFIKWNDAQRYPGMFKVEAGGLHLLKSVKCIAVPEVLLVDEADSKQFIVMKFVRTQSPVKNYWTLLGEQLARLHKNSSRQFGLDYDNYIGSINQINLYNSSWVDFFIKQRLACQADIAVKTNRADISLIRQLETLYKKLPDHLPSEKPALLHGDLWSGNVMVNENGEPCLIDPAVYYGHREMELAFTKLFGGFDHGFYEAYENAFPLQPGFDKRVDIYNLYPLLVHANLFGGSYFQQAERILKRYT